MNVVYGRNIRIIMTRSNIFIVILFLVTYGSIDCRRLARKASGNSESRANVYSKDLDEASAFLSTFNGKADELMTKNGQANWKYETDLTDSNLQKTVEAGMEVSEFFIDSSADASKLNLLDLPTSVHRQITLIRRSADPSATSMRSEIKETIGKMTSLFGKAKVDDPITKEKSTLSDLSDILKTSRDMKRLNWAWKAWRDKIGGELIEPFASLVDLVQIGAREHGWIDYGSFLRSDYEQGDDIIITLDKVWSAIEPLYKELHAYVRYKLHKKYKKFKKDDLVPASLFGDMFAQDWSNIFDIVKPCKKCKTFDVTSELQAQNYTVPQMVKLAESFFTSLGLSKMPESFWENSVFEKPLNKDMVCHASAWDVSKSDVRIKMCAKVNQEDFTTIHHEMGHIEYFLAYQKQPNTFRAGANPGFHEAIGDTISLSVETPAYLHKVGLMKTDTLSKDDTICFLLSEALRRIAPLPYNLLVDKWRWRVFEGNITESSYNLEWWKLRAKYQGVKPPVIRPTTAFDPASKYHIGANVPYVAYFVSYVLQFQLHKALCKEAKHEGPLHECSIHNSKEAGNKLKTMLEAGRSKVWPKILKPATGDSELKADAILEYFDPLLTWLKEQRASKNYPIGWHSENLSQVLQKKSKRYEAGQERSGILKTNSGDVSLSINIPSVALNELMSKKNEGTKEEGDLMKEQNNTISGQSLNETTKTVQTSALDIAKLLSSGSPLSIKTSETTATNKEGATEINQKEIDINSMGENVKQNKNEEKLSEGKQQLGISNSTLALIQQLLNARNNRTLAGVEAKNVTKSAPTVSVPIAANLKIEKEQPSVAAALPESKDNPKTAGVKAETSNPKSAAVTTEPKPNPVPEGQTQIALLPVALPASLITALRKAMTNSTTHNIHNNNSAPPENGNMDLSTLQTLVNPSQPTNETNAAMTTNATLPTAEAKPAIEVFNDTIAEPAAFINATSTEAGTQLSAAVENKNETAAAPAAEITAGNETVSTQIANSTQAANVAPQSQALNALSQPLVPNAVPQPQVVNITPEQQAIANQQQPINAAAQPQPQPVYNAAPQPGYPQVVEQPAVYNTYNYSTSADPFLDSMGFPDPFTQAQFVEGCKKDGRRCMKGKVVTEGNSFPMKRPAVDEARQTVSVSPSLLIQKLIEHHVADKSTPDPVVNIQPDDLKKNTTSSSPSSDGSTAEADNTKNSASAFDIGKIIKALTGTVSKPLASGELTNETTSTDKKHNLETSKSIKEQTKYDKTSFLESLKNCSDVMKRKVSLTFNCNNPIIHKGGSLSISPSELVQRLLDTKVKTEVNKKTIPSARVVKTPNGFQLNFDLNTKDNIPQDLKNKPIGRQQHVDVYNTPKGMVVKPKSSMQLLTPQFVPVQNDDHLELGKQEG